MTDRQPGDDRQLLLSTRRQSLHPQPGAVQLALRDGQVVVQPDPEARPVDAAAQSLDAGLERFGVPGLSFGPVLAQCLVNPPGSLSATPQALMVGPDRGQFQLSRIAASGQPVPAGL